MAEPNIANPLEIELKLESIPGKHIPNVQNWYAYTAHETRHYEDNFRRQYPKIKKRTSGCTSVYNCHGLVLASRRTAIIRSDIVRKTLDEDRYDQVALGNVLSGDIILYVHPSGEITHSGVVIQTETGILIPNNPLVLSKWGPWAEVIHYAYDCPYIREEPDVSLEYRRLNTINI